MRQIGLTDDELSGKHPAFLDRDRLGGDIPLERAPFVNGHHRLGKDFARHRSLDFDACNPERPEAVNIGLTIDDYVSSAKPAGNPS